MPLAIAPSDQAVNLIYFAKEVSTMLKMTPSQVRFLAKLVKVNKIYGVFYFTSADIKKIQSIQSN